MSAPSRFAQRPQRHRGTLLAHAGGLHRRGVPAARAEQTQQAAEQAERQAEIERDLQLARDIQQGLLLATVPQLPGWEIAALSLPARELGGDLYDFLPLSDGSCGIMIGDVSGKGLPAALRMAVARTIFRHAVRSGHAPGAALAAANRGVMSDIPQGMITMLFAALDLQTGGFRMANAGHTYPLVVGQSIRELELTGLPLGVDDDGDYSELVVTLAPGETVLLFTDGVIEAEDGAHEQFGDGRLAALLAARPGARPRALAAALLQELRAWSGGQQTDDITLVVLRRRMAVLAVELRVIADEVLGAARAAELWATPLVPAASASPTEWVEGLPELTKSAQQRFGRGLARELGSQLWHVIEEYRDAAQNAPDRV